MSTERFYRCFRIAHMIADISIHLIYKFVVGLCYYIFCAHILAFLQEVQNTEIQHINIEWFGNILVSTTLQTFLALLISHTGREHDERYGCCFVIVLTHPAEFVTIHHRHHHIAQDDVWTTVDDLVPGILTIDSLNNRIVCQYFVHKLTEVLTVVNEEHYRLLDHRFSRLMRTFTHSVENVLTCIRILISSLMHRGYDRCCSQGTEMCRRIRGGTALYRKVYHKDGSSAWIICNIYFTAMQFGKLLYQVQTYSATTLWLHFSAIDLIETLKHMFLLLIADALASIRY